MPKCFHIWPPKGGFFVGYNVRLSKRLCRGIWCIIFVGMKTNEILHKAFLLMDDVFTSTDFTKQIVKLGHPMLIRKNKGFGYFLKRYATNEYEYSKTWHKNKPNILLHQNNQTEITEESAIAYLKSKGYKIMKPTTEYKEI